MTHTPSAAELLPCPFCGSPAREPWLSANRWWVGCSDDDVCGSFTELALWNRRVFGSAQQRAEAQRLATEFDRGTYLAHDIIDAATLLGQIAAAKGAA